MEVDIASHLKKNILFGCLNSFQLSALSRIAAIKRYPKEALIFSEGDPALGFYIIAQGRVKIYKLSAQGKEYIMHIADRPGDTIAEVTVFSGEDYPAFAQAITDCALLFIPKSGFLSILKEYPEIGMRMLGALAARQRKFADIIEDLSLRDVLSRLSRHILNLSEKKQSNTFELDMRKSELALKLATIPETLSRNLRKLKTRKIISLKENKITILNKETLQRLAGKLPLT
ncbi:Crp/Fnr family transcriptional regulator [bacterium]|nr:MAG: Crp/Fnr family transcriptional regulator [bacterium]